MNSKQPVSLTFFKAILLSNKFKELFLYGIIGAGCASLDFVVYTLTLHLLGSDQLLFANGLGVVCGIMTSFTLNRKYNFKVKDKAAQRFVTFFLVGMLGLGISSCLLLTLVSYLGYNELVSKLITIAVVSIIQFLLNKTITFKQSK